jgi:hypothetical protein
MGDVYIAFHDGYLGIRCWPSPTFKEDRAALVDTLMQAVGDAVSAVVSKTPPEEDAWSQQRRGSCERHTRSINNTRFEVEVINCDSPAVEEWVHTPHVPYITNTTTMFEMDD